MLLKVVLSKVSQDTGCDKKIVNIDLQNCEDSNPESSMR